MYIYLVIGFIIGIFVSSISLFAFGKIIVKASPGTAIVRTGLGGKKVSLDSMIVLPSAHKHLIIDLSVKQFDTIFKNESCLKTRSGESFELIINTKWRVNKNLQDIINVYEIMGEKHSDIDFIEKHFSPLIKQAGNSLSKHYHEFEDIDLLDLKNSILDAVGHDLGGFILDDLYVVSAHKL